MSNYISPADLLAPYLQPLTANFNQGIGTGINLLNVQHGIARDRVNAEYAKQRIAASKANEARMEALTGKLTTEEARQKNAVDYWNNQLAPKDAFQFDNPYDPGEVTLAGADRLQINPFVNLGGLSPREVDAARIAATPTGTRKVIPAPLTAQDIERNPYLSLSERIGLRSKDQSADLQDKKNALLLTMVEAKIESANEIARLNRLARGEIAANKPEKTGPVNWRVRTTFFDKSGQRHLKGDIIPLDKYNKVHEDFLMQYGSRLDPISTDIIEQLIRGREQKKDNGGSVGTIYDQYR